MQEVNEKNTEHLSPCFDVVSRVGYFLGISSRLYWDGDIPFRPEVYEELNAQKDARIIRNLSKLRTAVLKKYPQIDHEFRYNMKNIDTLPDYIRPEISVRLREDGLEAWHANLTADQYLVFCNEEIKRRISNCRSMFPIWLNWDYIKELYVIPAFKTEKQIRAVRTSYMTNIAWYPYQLYLNWKASDSGNILYNDEKFVAQILYPMHRQAFEDLSKVKNASVSTQRNIREFLLENDKTVLVVDCENSDPFKLYSVLNNLGQETRERICKIILYNDVHTSVAWRLLNRFVSGVEHVMIPRVKEDKSLVDISLAVGACREYYERNVTSFVLVSSDSDYWGLINGLPECAFLVLVEKEKTSRSIREAMERNDISYAYMDDFCSGNLESIQSEALLLEIGIYLQKYEIDVNKLMQKAILNTRVTLSQDEIDQFMNKYLKKIHTVQKDGFIRMEI